jgi:hypothetical protein
MSARKIDSPFVGLVPYTEEDAEFFFGRERDQQRILANLFASRLTILYGASGVGKSSVLRAGIIREVRERIQAAVESGENPEVAVVYCKDWKGDVLARLRAAIGSALHDLLGRDYVAELDSSLSLKQLLLEIGKRFDGDLLLIFDQFEEYFLYHPGTKPDAFAMEFAEAANHAGLAAHFLLALRDDAVSRLDRFKPLIPGLFSNYLRLHHLSAEDARTAILQPVARYNELPDERRGVEGRFSVAPDLPGVVIEEVYTGRVLVGQVGQGTVGASRAVAVETPYLQMVMTRLWQAEVSQGSHELRTETLRVLGGADAIVKGHLEAALAGFSEREKQFCAAVFPHLVTPSGTKIAHTLPNLAKFAKVAPEELTPLLDTLASPEKRILAPVAPPDSEPGQMQYEIYHDSLAQAVLSWLARYEAERERNAREREKHRLLVYAVAFAIAFLIAAAGAGVAIWQWRSAVAERAHATQAEAAASRAAEEALALRAEAQAAGLKLQIAEAQKSKDASRVAELQQLLTDAQSDAAKYTQWAKSKGPPTGNATLTELVHERDQLRRDMAKTTAEQAVQGAANRTVARDPGPTTVDRTVRDPQLQQLQQQPAQQPPAQQLARAPDVKKTQPEESKKKESPPEPDAKTLSRIAWAALSQLDAGLSIELARYVGEKARAEGMDPPFEAEIVLRGRLGAMNTVTHGLSPRLLALADRGGTTIAALHDGQTCCVVDLGAGSKTCFPNEAHLMQWSPEGSELVLGGHGIVVFDPAGKQQVNGPKNRVALSALAVARDGTIAYSWEGSNEIHFFSTRRHENTQFANRKRIVALAFPPTQSNSSLTSVDADGAVRVWDYPTGEARELFRVDHRPTGIAYVGVANNLAVTYANGIVLRDMNASRNRDLKLKKVVSFSFSPDGKRLAVGDGSKVGLLVPPGVYPLAEYPGRLAEFSRDGRMLVIANANDLQIYPGDMATLLTRARMLSKRRLTASECKEYLGLNSCPSF